MEVVCLVLYLLRLRSFYLLFSEISVRKAAILGNPASKRLRQSHSVTRLQIHLCARTAGSKTSTLVIKVCKTESIQQYNCVQLFQTF